MRLLLDIRLNVNVKWLTYNFIALQQQILSRYSKPYNFISINNFLRAHNSIVIKSNEIQAMNGGKCIDFFSIECPQR